MSAQAKTTDKETKRLAVSIAILEVIEKEGILGVTHSKVSRKSGVSRAWIYEYIGKEKDALIEFGADVFGGYFTRADVVGFPREKNAIQAQLREGGHFLLDTAASNPLIVKLYFKFRGSENSLGEVIRKYESQWIKGATQSLVQSLGIPLGEAEWMAESAMTFRMAYAHRVATSRKTEKTRKNADRAFEWVHSLIESP